MERRTNMSDLIKREDAIKATWQEPTYTDPLNVLTEVRDRIESIPSADRPQGEWIEDNLGTVICSECKRPRRDNRIGHVNFCNSCGARMEGADDEID
jgi:hypothetical protein